LSGFITIVPLPAIAIRSRRFKWFK